MKKKTKKIKTLKRKRNKNIRTPMFSMFINLKKRNNVIMCSLNPQYFIENSKKNILKM